MGLILYMDNGMVYELDMTFEEFSVRAYEGGMEVINAFTFFTEKLAINPSHISSIEKGWIEQ